MCCSRRGFGLAVALLFVCGSAAVENVTSTTDHTQDAQRAYEIPDAGLLEYVKAQMLRGLGLQEPPRVSRAAVMQNREYERVYDEYRRRLEEDNLLEDPEDAEDPQNLQRMYTIRASGKFPFLRLRTLIEPLSRRIALRVSSESVGSPTPFRFFV